jgi:tRNA-(ms[2]io[6]A)-hydroxylase
MLHLTSPSRPDWLPQVLAALDELLLDHAHCEKKAASMALNFAFRYPDHAATVSPLAREELRHFEQLLALLSERSIPFVRQQPSGYGGQLMTAARRQEPQRKLDLLLLSSLIEARSCERMKLLAAAFGPDGPAPDPQLARLYSGLLACEARHHHTYVDLCNQCFGPEETAARLGELAAHEASVLVEPGRLPRMHS